MSLVEVRLQGEAGKKFGRIWNVHARNPGHALRIINANTGGQLMTWIRAKASKYTHYKIQCEYEDGRKAFLDDNTYQLDWGKVKRVRYTPVVVGASGVVKAVVGVVLIVGGVYFNQPWAIQMGTALVMGGISEMLAPKPKKGSSSDKRTSHYFNGTEQTQEQGAPIQLIYGRCLVSGFPISVSMEVEQRLSGYVKP